MVLCMKINAIDKIKTVAYATYLNANGYTVLKNPKGTPSTFVRAVRNRRGINTETLDTYETYKRVTLDLSQPKKKQIHEYFFRDNFAFFNKDSNKVDYKKQVHYSKYEIGEKGVSVDKNWIEPEVLDKRNYEPLHTKNPVDTSTASKPVTENKSIAEIETEKYIANLSEKKREDAHYSFLSTLIHNLKSAK